MLVLDNMNSHEELLKTIKAYDLFIYVVLIVVIAKHYGIDIILFLIGVLSLDYKLVIAL